MSSVQVFQTIKDRLNQKSILFSEDSIGNRPTVIGYEKIFRWQWMATQMNAFIIVSNFGDELVSSQSFDQLFPESFGYAKLNYRGWPRGIQSTMAIIIIAISENIDNDAINYCTELQARKSWAGFSVPVAIDASSDKVHFFNRNPLRGIIYYPYYRRLITEVTS